MRGGLAQLARREQQVLELGHAGGAGEARAQLLGGLLDQPGERVVERGALLLHASEQLLHLANGAVHVLALARQLKRLDEESEKNKLQCSHAPTLRCTGVELSKCRMPSARSGGTTTGPASADAGTVG